MSQRSSIEWTDATWNPIRGCSCVSEGCRHCYAKAFAARFSGPGQPYEGLAVMKSDGPHWTGKVRLIESVLDLPLRWRKPSRIFVNSMSDLFHESVPDEWIDRIFAVMALASQHSFQVLTKRPHRMLRYFTTNDCGREFHVRQRIGLEQLQIALERKGAGKHVGSGTRISCEKGSEGELVNWPLPHVWLGISAEDQPTADERIPLLLQTPAAVRFVSYEPALAAVDFSRINYRLQLRSSLKDFLKFQGKSEEEAAKEAEENTTGGEEPVLDVLKGHYFDGWDSGTDGKKLDWIVVGGESGPHARPFDVQWARDVIAQCRAAGVACFVKQLGARPLMRNGDAYALGHKCGAIVDGTLGTVPVHLHDRKGGDMAEWPEDLCVREFPAQEKTQP